MAWVDLKCLGFPWVDLEWLGLSWVDLSWLGLAWVDWGSIRLTWVALGWLALGRSGLAGRRQEAAAIRKAALVLCLGLRGRETSSYTLRRLLVVCWAAWSGSVKLC